MADIPTPEPLGDQVLVRVKACGVCRTDLHIVEGELKPRKSPLVPGHQVVGVIQKMGPEAHRFPVGARVGIAWLHQTDGVCEYCSAGKENLCPQATFTGYTVDGGYAEYAVAPEAFVYPIPESFSDVDAAPLLCAGIIGFRALRLSAIQPGGRLGFYGFGARRTWRYRWRGTGVLKCTCSRVTQRISGSRSTWAPSRQDTPAVNIRTGAETARAG